MKTGWNKQIILFWFLYMYIYTNLYMDLENLLYTQIIYVNICYIQIIYESSEIFVRQQI